MKCNCVLFMRFLGEFTATALFIFLGCLGCSGADDSTGGILKQSLQFGFVTTLVLHCFGYISGAQLNPCVSIACFIIGFIKGNILVINILGQILGALWGYFMLILLLPSEEVFGNKPGLCMTAPLLTTNATFVIEFILTSIMILSYCAFLDMRNFRFVDSTAVRMGMVVTACNIAAGKLTGANMNPIRTLAPAIFQKNMSFVFTYLSGQFLASILVPCLWLYIFTPSYLRYQCWEQNKNENKN